MKNPPHPGKVVRVSSLEPSGLNVTEGAKVLGVRRVDKEYLTSDNLLTPRTKFGLMCRESL